MREAIYSSVLAEKNQCKMELVKATDLVFAAEASLPEDELPDWPVSVLKLLLVRVLKCKNSWSGVVCPVKDKLVGHGLFILPGGQSLEFNNHIRDISHKTNMKMMTSMQITFKPEFKHFQI